LEIHNIQISYICSINYFFQDAFPSHFSPVSMFYYSCQLSVIHMIIFYISAPLNFLCDGSRKCFFNFSFIIENDYPVSSGLSYTNALDFAFTLFMKHYFLSSFSIFLFLRLLCHNLFIGMSQGIFLASQDRNFYLVAYLYQRSLAHPICNPCILILEFWVPRNYYQFSF